jgi:hypothetical protein
MYQPEQSDSEGSSASKSRNNAANRRVAITRRRVMVGAMEDKKVFLSTERLRARDGQGSEGAGPVCTGSDTSA